MADSDYFSYSSIYTEFSKGPKSIYFGIGDEMLPGGILNVPQTDEDDEWGRTQRISEERVYDFIAKIYKTLFDPYNSLPGIGLVPGEAGSELNVAKNMIQLVGRSGIDAGVFDLTVPKLTLGQTVLNGSDNSLSIGSGMLLEETSLKLNTDFLMDSISNKGTISYRDVAIEFSDDDSTVAEISVKINGQGYVFNDVGLTLPNGKKLLGELSTKDILPQSNSSYNIGSSDYKYKEAFIFCGYINTLYTSTILPLTSLNTVSLGSDVLTDNVNVRVSAFNIYQKNLSDSALSVGKDIDDVYFVRVGNEAAEYAVNITGNKFNVYTSPSNLALSANDTFFYLNRNAIPAEVDSVVSIGMNGFRFESLWVKEVHSKTGEFIDRITSHDIYPETDDSFSIGSSDYKFSEGYFKTLKAKTLSSTQGVLYLCSDGMNILNSVTESSIMYLGRNEITTYADIKTINIFPSNNNSYDIGSALLNYRNLYTVKANIYSGIYSDSTSDWTFCGPSMKIRVQDDLKMAVCNAQIEMFTNLYTQDILPRDAGGAKSIGSPSLPYDRIYLNDLYFKDYGDASLRRVHFVCGVMIIG